MMELEQTGIHRCAFTTRHLRGACGFLAAAAIAATLCPRGALAEPVPGRVVIKFADSLTQCAHCLLEQGAAFSTALTDGSDDIDAANAASGVTAAHEIFFARHGMTTEDAEQAWADRLTAVKNRYPARTRRIHPDAVPPSGLVNVYQFDVPIDANPYEVCARYGKSHHVEWCTPDLRAHVTFEPNDPFYGTRGAWNQPYLDLWGLDIMSMPKAWKTSLGDGITVAVVDSGVDISHPDIAANVWTNPYEIPGNGVDDDGNGCIDDMHGCDYVVNLLGGGDIVDPFGHGTHVAGTLAAVGDNGEGIVGVAPDVKVMSARGLNEFGGGDFGLLVKAMNYAAMNGADVINNSWGCLGEPADCSSNPPVETAVRLAGALGVVVVFAAGNEARNVYGYSPENMTDPLYKPVVVAAHDERRLPARYPGGRGTNFGPTVDVMAPGGGTLVSDEGLEWLNILSLRSQQCPLPGPFQSFVCSNPVRVPTEDSLYSRLAGTSMAAPHVSGLAALVLSCNPGLRSPDVRHVIEASARKRKSDDLYGHGPASGFGALALTASPTVAITAPERFQLSSVGAEMEIRATASSPDVTVNSWWVEVADQAPAAGRDYTRIAKGKGPVVGTVARWTQTSPGTKSVKFRVRVRFPADRPVDSTYICGDPRVPRRVRTRYLEEVQFFHTEVPLERVTSGDRIYATPSVSGDRIAAEEAPEFGMTRIYVHDLDSVQLLGSPGSREPSLDDSDSRRLVWIDPGGGSDEVWMHDFATGTSTQLTANGRAKDGPRISGNWVAFRELQGDGAYQIALHDLGAGTTALLSSGPNVTTMAMSGDRLLWGSGYGTSVSARHLSTGATETVFMGYDTLCMDVSGDWLVSLSTAFALPDGRIVARHLVTGQELDVAGGILSPAAGELGCPSISGTLVAYTRDLGVEELPKRFPHYRDFMTESASTRMTYHDGTDAQGIDVSGGRIVWVDNREGAEGQLWRAVR